MIDRLPRLVLAVALLPLALLVLHTILQAGADVEPSGDYAVIEGMVRFAGGDFEQLGLYSRYGWRHPGPGYFYLQLPFYELFGGRAIGLMVGVALLNLAAVGGALLVIARVGGRLLAAWAAVPLTIFVAVLDAALFRDFWTPNAIILLFALFTVLCAALAAGWLTALPLVVLTGSLLAQTHVGTSGAVVALGVLGTALYAINRRVERRPLIERAGPGRRALLRALAPVGAAALVAAVVWFPPLLDEAQNSPGNLARARSFLSSQPASHPGQEARWNIVQAYAVLPSGLDAFRRPLTSDVPPSEPSGFAKLWSYGTLLLLIAGAAVGYWRRRWFPAALCLLSLALVPVAFYSLQRVAGTIYPYLIFWLATGSVTGWIGIAGSLAPELGRRPALNRPRALAAVAAVPVLVAAGFGVQQVLSAEAPDDAYNLDGVSETARVVDRHLDRVGSERPLIEIPNDERWPTGAGVAVVLLREGRDPAIEPKAFRFGTHMAPTGREDARVILAGPASRPQPDPNLLHIGTVGDTFVFVTRDGG